MLHSKKNKDWMLFYVILFVKAFYFFLANHNNYKCQIIHILSCCFFLKCRYLPDLLYKRYQGLYEK